MKIYKFLCKIKEQIGIEKIKRRMFLLKFEYFISLIFTEAKNFMKLIVVTPQSLDKREKRKFTQRASNSFSFTIGFLISANISSVT